jgi:hypothetical protein
VRGMLRDIAGGLDREVDEEAHAIA